MSEREFLDRVELAFHEEVSNGILRIISHIYSPEAFGNAIVVLEAADFQLKLRRNMSEEFAEVAHQSSLGEWYILQLVVRAVEGHDDPPEYRPGAQLLDVESAATLYHAHRDALIAGYGKNWRKIRKALVRMNSEFDLKRDAWHASPEGKRWYANIVAETENERKNPSPELLAALKEMGLAPQKAKN